LAIVPRIKPNADVNSQTWLLEFPSVPQAALSGTEAKENGTDNGNVLGDVEGNDALESDTPDPVCCGLSFSRRPSPAKHINCKVPDRPSARLRERT
jgi:hypothetical protein